MSVTKLVLKMKNKIEKKNTDNNKVLTFVWLQGKRNKNLSKKIYNLENNF